MSKSFQVCAAAKADILNIIYTKYILISEKNYKSLTMKIIPQ